MLADSTRQALVLLIAMQSTNIQLILLIGQYDNRLTIDVGYIGNIRYINWGMINVEREEKRSR